MVYQNTLEYAEHLVLVKGNISNQSTLVRMHQHNILQDSLGGSQTLQKSMQLIEANGSGVIVVIRTPDKSAISRQITQNSQNTLREYGIGAQILLDLGLKQIELLTNSQKSVVGLEGYGLEIVGYRPII